MGAANVGVATPVNISSVTGGSQQTGAGGSVTVTTADNGKLLTGADELLAELNAGTNPTTYHHYISHLNSNHLQRLRTG